MSHTFCIFPERGLVVARCVGVATIDGWHTVSQAYMEHPDYAVGQKQLVDLSQITGYEKDYVRFMEMQASKAERLAGAGVQYLAVYLAPTPVSQELAMLFSRSWANISTVRAMIQTSEADALAILGQPETNIDAICRATEDAPVQQPVKGGGRSN